jgi:S-adenosylhomocysteine hydrolase
VESVPATEKKRELTPEAFTKLPVSLSVDEGKLEAKLRLLPEEVDTEIDRLRLTAMKVSIDELTPEMVE